MLKHVFTLIALLALCAPVIAQEVNIRVKDATRFRLSGGDTLEGQGLVYGLNGTGDADDKLAQEMARARAAHGGDNKLDDKNYTNEDFSADNICRVVVTLKVESGEGVAGNVLSATISIADNATSLRGGQLLLTSLKNASDATDAVIYATASGAIYIPPVAGGQGNNAAAPNGQVDATLVEDIDEIFYSEDKDEYGNTSYNMTLQLHKPSTTNANAIARSINNDPNILGLASTVGADGELPQAPRVARAEGSGKVVIDVPAKWHKDLMEFREIIENASFPAEVPAEVIINMESGVITVSSTVRFSPGTIIAAGVTIQLGANGELPTPDANADGTRDPAVPLTQDSRNVNDELMQTLNVLNLSAAEKAEVFRALDKAGMLHGKLVIDR